MNIKTALTLATISSFGGVGAWGEEKPNVYDINPNLHILASCQGGVKAMAIASHLNGLMTEDRARTMVNASFAGMLLGIYKAEDREHSKKYSEYYDKASSEAFEDFYKKLEEETFDWDDQVWDDQVWDDQVVIDNCMARLIEPLINPPIDELEVMGVDNYGIFLSIVTKQSDEDFDFILRLAEASR